MSASVTVNTTALTDAVINAGGAIPVGELIATVARDTGADVPLIVAMMWDLIEAATLNYGVDAVVRAVPLDAP